MSELSRVLDAFHQATRCAAGLWMEDGDAARAEAATAGAPALTFFPAGTDGPTRVESPLGVALVAAVPGPRRAWLVLGPCSAPGASLEGYMSFMLPVAAQYLQSALEVEHAANELAERYEEINLLYTISEILGRTVALDEAARTILTEISETVGARRASILVHERASDTLRPVAALGLDAATLPVIPIDDANSVSARVFRTQHPMLAEPGQFESEAEAPYRRGAMLSVPIMWTAPAPAGA